jgi:hypothetical protein
VVNKRDVKKPTASRKQKKKRLSPNQTGLQLPLAPSDCRSLGQVLRRADQLESARECRSGVLRRSSFSTATERNRENKNQETKHEVENELATTYHSGLEQDSDFKRLQINMSSGTPAKEHLGSRSGVLPSSS